MLIRAEGVAKSFGPNQVLKSIKLQINRGDRMALIGINGSGKSTLLQILTGELKPDLGELIIKTDKVGYLPQMPAFNDAETVLEAVKGASISSSLSQRIGELENMMSSGVPDNGLTWDDIAEEYGRLRGQIDRFSGDLNSRERDILSRMGIDQEMLSKNTSQLSGGETTKVMLAKVLLRAKDLDLIILDEPTSHLDISGVEWLEDFLLKLDCAQIVVSHDRYFLDNVMTKVIELERGKLRAYSGNYSSFTEKKTFDVERQWKESEKNRIERERQERVMEDLHRREWFGTTHKTRQKMIDRMDQVERPYKDQEIMIDIGVTGKSGKNMILAKDLQVRRGRKEVLGGLDLSLETGDKLGIFGPNGSGKTTLIKALLQELSYAGEMWIAPGARIGYYAQGHDMLNNTMTPEEQLLKIMGEEERLTVRRLLAKLLLTGEQVERPIGTLSGGERARVALAVLIADRRNLLIMDEPTNYLDIPAKHSVESALSEYPGTLLIVTHDRYLMDAVCNKVGLLKDGKLDVHFGNYSSLRGRPIQSTKVEEALFYRVVSPFTEWRSRKKYLPGERIAIAESEMERFQWALETGKIKRIPGKEMKRVFS
jgi:ATP-binding cassette subfamily F protein 3